LALAVGVYEGVWLRGANDGIRATASVGATVEAVLAERVGQVGASATRVVRDCFIAVVAIQPRSDATRAGAVAVTVGVDRSDESADALAGRDRAARVAAARVVAARVVDDLGAGDGLNGRSALAAQAT
jgi:hypothetical protein